METTQESIERWLDKQNIVHPYSGLLFRPDKEGQSDPFYNMDEPWGHDEPYFSAQRNKPDTEG